MQKNNALKIIKFILKNKYRQILLAKSDIKKIIDLKKKIIKKNIQIKKYNEIKKPLLSKNVIKTNIFLERLFLKKNFTKKDKKNIFLFYKKFSTNLRLLKSYNNSFKKKTKLETNFESYIYLGNLIFKINFVNKIQKLNCLLKLNDKILVNGNFKNNSFLYKIFQKNLKKEFNLINHFLK